MTGALAFDDGSQAVRVRVPAKINLHLGVGDRRADGYHDLTTVYQGISLYDEVTVIAGQQPGVRVEVFGDDAEAVPLGTDNLAVKAVLALGEEFGVAPAVTVRIAKRIPIAGGLAGGSADAAAALVACSRLWGMPFTDRLVKVAAGLGSDVPFCLSGGTALGTGHGERVEEVTANGRYHWVVATADGQLSTPAVYAEVDRLRESGIGSYSSAVTELLEALRTGRAEELAPQLRNDMTEAAMSLRPQLREILTAGADDGALAALLSGSGPTTLFLARDVHHATALAGRLRMRRLAREVHCVHAPAFVSVGLSPAQPG
ncbi:4-(cytidine 5'-diphospho)-2-C-methyl-D-erythritol kinase [Stackebrandtia nassauensis]|uniref:4-diphosphocytidyl-2-C-methyl-D-erythritol kinase n=1 Tax=Stackebrandtia nassauensis (strain DSM 44728 / CIP 108903 / NRRL B-16338 / NBRC 102104 / LLR-40K-21) TaxID=446470 RepID=D3QA07_STANL|nr:4-(cytidine 5'-diphospho)-2-C-methyl-D-erythritol kinase [Stackebrandtia nassauensis]ADD40719.1 4-diphosphocytidyl-2C-methyl-D-erythritolkinase [Stackebrandtia nassauensis DSM 44728]